MGSELSTGEQLLSWFSGIAVVGVKQCPETDPNEQR